MHINKQNLFGILLKIKEDVDSLYLHLSKQDYLKCSYGLGSIHSFIDSVIEINYLEEMEKMEEDRE